MGSSALSEGAAAIDAPRVSPNLSVLLLGWIAAAKGAGIGLIATAIVPATAALHMNEATRAICAAVVGLTMAATAIPAGVVADKIGRRHVLMWSCALVVVGSAAAIAAWWWPILVGGLMVVGVGFSGLITASYGYLKAIGSDERLGMNLGLFALFTTMVGAPAAVAGGLLATNNWRALLLIAPAMCLVALPLIPRMLPPMPPTDRPQADVAGLLLLGLGLVLFVGGLSRGVSHPDRWAVGASAIGVVVMGLWAIYESRLRDPSFPVQMFTSGHYVAAFLIGCINTAIFSAVTLAIIDKWQYVNHDSPLGTTAGMQPLYFIGVIGGLVAGRRLSAGTLPRRFVVIGGLLTAGGLLMLSSLGQGAGYLTFIPGMVLVGLGSSVSSTAQGQIIVRTAPTRHYGSVTASRTTMGQLGSAVGTIICVGLLDRLTAGGMLSSLEFKGYSVGQSQQILQQATGYLAGGDPTTVADMSDIFGSASVGFTSAFQSVMLLGAIASLVVTGVGWVLLRRSSGVPPGENGFRPWWRKSL